MRHRLLEVLLGVRPGESYKVWLMFCYSLGAVAAPYVVGRTAVNALILSTIDKRLLPYTYLGTALAASLAVVIYTVFSGRIRLERMIVYTSAGFALAAVLLRQMLTVAPHSFAVLFSIHVLIEVLGPLCLVQFWTYAGEVFNFREAKRLYGVIAAGGVLSNVVFGSFIRNGIAFYGQPANLLYLVAGLLLLCMTAVLLLERKGSGRANRSRRSDFDGDVAGSGNKILRQIQADALRIGGSRHLRSIAALLCLVAAVCSVVDYQWKLAVRDMFAPNAEQIARFNASLYIVAGSMAFASQILLTRLVLERVGIRAALTALPVCLLIASIAVLAAPADRLLWPLTAAKGAETILRYTVYDSGIQLLYLTLAPRFRSRAKPLIDGVARTLCVALVAVLLIVLEPAFTFRALSWGVVPATVVWLAVAWRSRRHYVASLQESLDRRQLGRDAVAPMFDHSTIRVLERALLGSDVGRALGAMELLPLTSARDWDPLVRQLLSSPHAELRRAAIEHLCREGSHECLPLLNPRDPDPRVRAAIVRALARIGAADWAGHVRSYLSDRDPQVRAAAVECLMRNGDAGNREVAARHFETLCSAEDSCSRHAAARTLKELGADADFLAIRRLVQDGDPTVRAEALQAAAGSTDPVLLQLLVGELGSSQTAKLVASALIAARAAAIKPLTTALRDPDSPTAVRARIPPILAQLGGTEALDVLWESLGDREDAVRSASVLAAARFVGRTVPPLRFHTGICRLCEEEARSYFQWINVYVGLNDTKAVLLQDAVKRRSDQLRMRVLNLVCVLDAQLKADALELALRTGDSLRANAVELLDNTIPKRLRPVVLMMLEGSLEEQAAFGRKMFPQIQICSPREWMQQLSSFSEAWIAQCAQFHLEQLRAETNSLTGLKTATGSQSGDQTKSGWIVPVSFDDEGHERDPEEEGAIGTGIPQPGGEKFMLTAIEKVLLLRSVELLSDLPGEALMEVAEISKPVSCELGDVLMKQGDPGDCLYLVVEGEMEVTIDGHPVARIHTGDLVGEFSVLDSEPRSGTVIAVKDALLLRIEQDDFFVLMGRYVGIARSVIRSLVRRLRANNQLKFRAQPPTK